MKQICMILVSLVLMTFTGPGGFAAETAKTSLEALQAAFNGESNANAKYLAFANKADEDGYAGVASLFRAAAKAEEVHLTNHAAVIRKMGAEPKADIKTPEVKNTMENLQAAQKGETYERDEMYPAFIKLAQQEKNSDAQRTFRFALAAEGGHARLYGEALNNLENDKIAKEFMVCPVCGYTAVTLTGSACPVCATPAEKFIKIK